MSAVTEKAIQTFARLPESTGAWSCRWFLTILYLSATLALASAFSVPDTIGVVGLVVAAAVAAFAIGMREIRKGGGSCSTQ